MNALTRVLPNPRVRRLLLMVVLPIIIILLGLWYWTHSTRYQSTDNAYVYANQVSVTPQVTGRVIAVPVVQNQAVTPGQVLIEIDPAPFQLALDQANANLKTVSDQIHAQQQTLRAAQAELQGARANVAFLQRDLRRKTNLAQKDVVPQARLDDLRTNLVMAQQKTVALKAQIAQIQASLGGNAYQPIAQQPAYQKALAARDKAALELSYTTIKAAAAGVVTEVNVKPGDVVTSGRPVFALVMSGDRWVDANFKETQLTHVHVGQKAEITVDAYPHRSWEGTVVSIAPGTGSVFSVLPPQNATGNWVKVVQRIPVRILIDTSADGPDLRAGMSAEVTIDTHYSLFFGAPAAKAATHS
ncbi:MAG: HlyD family secretion protein [Gammaproteobacteria bacterium]|nr:HlyD family secretion protein [Gammaproteobacteria bacterium]MBU6510415.1 HlyD family secretion protein [Gammaproteobacteria bacterium]MDE1984180.1 HlyD family secretion protein [Gammaproteobacteria bacterium]MDE2108910.1 HlyD family secretion protein [Gammaproteobacteria bacterium]